MTITGIIMTILSLFGNFEFYNIFFSVCLGLFIGGILFSAISFFLAQMESNISGQGEVDVDVDVDVDIDVDIDSDFDVDIDSDFDVDIDSDIDVDIDSDIDVDIDSDVDVDIDSDVDIDIDSDVDVDIDSDAEVESEIDSNLSDITPAPIMLLLSASFLVYGISGIILYYVIMETLRFLIFFATPAIVYVNWKIINKTWKKIAKSRYYTIASSKNLLGLKAEVVLRIDERGGVVKIPSYSPMRYERIHVKPLNPESQFVREEKVYICDVKNGFLLVDNNKNLIKKRRF